MSGVPEGREPVTSRDERRRIRLATPADGAALAEIYAPAVIERATSFELEAPNGEEMSRRVSAILTRTPWIVCVIGDTLAGYAYASAHRARPAYQWSVDVSAYVDPALQRSGVGRALYTSLFVIVALQGFRNAYAGIALPNPASVGFHEALGFQLVGVYHRVGYKLGAWHDVMWLERQLAPHTVSPTDPVPLPLLVDTPDFAEALACGASMFARPSP
jgi:L-amino acid N-acyltransferase YncA